MTWKCPGCEHIYLTDECPTCHMKGGPILWPVPIKVDGVEYLVQRQINGPTAIVTADGQQVHQPQRANVIRAFLAQQRPTV